MRVHLTLGRARRCTVIHFSDKLRYILVIRKHRQIVIGKTPLITPTKRWLPMKEAYYKRRSVVSARTIAPKKKSRRYLSRKTKRANARKRLWWKIRRNLRLI